MKALEDECVLEQVGHDLGFFDTLRHVSGGMRSLRPRGSFLGVHVGSAAGASLS